MPGFNSITVMGHLATDPEVRSTSSGKSVGSFRMAVPEGYSRDSKVTWVTVVAWERMAETVCTWISKGDLVLVSGRLTSDEWTDRNGSKRLTIQIQASTIQLCRQKGVGQSVDSEAGEGENRLSRPTVGRDDEDDFAAPPEDDMPF